VITSDGLFLGTVPYGVHGISSDGLVAVGSESRGGLRALYVVGVNAISSTPVPEVKSFRGRSPLLR
jgi:hypothetical protein